MKQWLADINNLLVSHKPVRFMMYFVGFFLIGIASLKVRTLGVEALDDVIIRLFPYIKTGNFTSRIYETMIELLWALGRDLLFRPIILTFLVYFLESKRKKCNSMVVNYLPIIIISLGICSLFLGYEEGYILFVEGAIILCLLFCKSRLICLQHKLRASLYFIGFFFLGFGCWTRFYFNQPTMDQLISTFIFGAEGLINVSHSIISSFLASCFIPPWFFTIFILLVEKWLASYVLIHNKVTQIFYTILPLTVVAAGMIFLSQQYHVAEFLNYFHSVNPTEDLFAEQYRDPRLVSFESKKPKNLVLIYVESLETTYAKKKLFNRNLLVSLKMPTGKSIQFKQFKQMPGADWTIAGMVSSQCGIPYITKSIFGHNSQGETFNNFLPGAVCLSDILDTKGYKNVFLKGASLTFSGVDRFLKTHHYTDIMGKDEWLKLGIPRSKMIGWGLPDDILFQQAKLKLNNLMNSQKHFNLTILTIDTHGIDGQLNKTCEAQGGQTFEDIVACTANQLAKFIGYIEQKGWLKKITVVVMGDHLAMENAVSNKLNTIKSRHIFNMILSDDTLSKNREIILHVDMLPSILNTLGFSFEGEKLALGFSAFKPSRELASSSERLQTMDKIIATRSDFYDKFWIKGK